MDRLTTKTREALLAAQQAALEQGNPELRTEHLLSALLAEPQGVTGAILQKANVDPAPVLQQLGKRIAGFPKVQGGSEPALSRGLRELLTSAWKETQALKDEYTSAEHIQIGRAHV